MMRGMQRDIQAMVDLRFRAYSRHPEFLATATSRAAIARFLGAGYLEAQARGVVEVRYQGAEIEAYCLLWPEEEAWFGRPSWWCAIDYRTEHPANRLWVEEVVGRHPEFAHPDFHCELDAAYRGLLPTLMQRGLGIDAITYLGSPKQALEALLATRNPPLHLKAMGLEIAPLSSGREIAQVLALREAYFRAHPEYCFFGASAEFLAGLKTELIGILSKHEPFYVILRGDRVVGYFSADIEESHAYWGRVAGMDIILDPSLQGRGIVKSVYAILLRELVNREVQVFKGGTSQPSIIGLATLLKRPRLAFCLRQDATFPPEHFGLNAQVSEVQETP